MEEKINAIIDRFDLPAVPQEVVPYGNGHINETYRVTTAQGRFILQMISSYVFPHPEEVMENIELVTDYLKQQILADGGDPARETLSLVKTHGGSSFVLDEDGHYWRIYPFIEGTISRDLPDTPELFALSGEAFGKFQRQLKDFPAQKLHEVIRDFHNTPARYQQLEDAIHQDACGRVKNVQPEIAFCQARQAETGMLLDAIRQGEIPLRVTHNDTKLNNVLLDAVTGQGICVIDLDTVMPGAAAYDFGDSIRFGANTAAEDERDLSLVHLSLPMFEAFTKGYLKEMRNALNAKEIELLPMGAKLMTLECGMRFLADHLNGDKYFHIHRENHNLDRARTQFALVKEMEDHWDEMMQIVQTCSKA